jgi:hypothetical protein
VILEANHDPAPAAAIMGTQTFNGRIVVGNSALHKNRIWWTQPFEPSYFRGAGNDAGGDWLDVGTDDKDEIRAIVVRPSMLVIYRAKSIWTHTGDLGDASAILQPACLDVGIAGARAVASTAAGDYFVDTVGEGAWRFNNDWPSKLSQKIEPLFRGRPNDNFSCQDPTFAKLAAVGHHLGRLYVSYKAQGAPEARSPAACAEQARGWRSWPAASPWQAWVEGVRRTGGRNRRRDTERCRRRNWRLRSAGNIESPDCMRRILAPVRNGR